MIDFDKELEKYDYILTVEDVAQKVSSENEQDDFIRILDSINKKIDKTVGK